MILDVLLIYITELHKEYRSFNTSCCGGNVNTNFVMIHVTCILLWYMK